MSETNEMQILPSKIIGCKQNVHTGDDHGLSRIGNALQAHRDFVGCNSNPVALIKAMYGWKVGAMRLQAFSKVGSALYNYYTTQGQYGFGTVHLLREVPLLKYVLSENAQESIVGQVVEHMQRHPDEGRAMSWLQTGIILESKNVKLLNTLRQRMELLEKQSKAARNGKSLPAAVVPKLV